MSDNHFVNSPSLCKSRDQQSSLSKVKKNNIRKQKHHIFPEKKVPKKINDTNVVDKIFSIEHQQSPCQIPTVEEKWSNHPRKLSPKKLQEFIQRMDVSSPCQLTFDAYDKQILYKDQEFEFHSMESKKPGRPLYNNFPSSSTKHKNTVKSKKTYHNKKEPPPVRWLRREKELKQEEESIQEYHKIDEMKLNSQNKEISDDQQIEQDLNKYEGKEFKGRNSKPSYPHNNKSNKEGTKYLPSFYDYKTFLPYKHSHQ